MTPPRDPPHHLKALASTTTPKRLLWVDCVAKTLKQGAGSVDRWDAGALGTTHYTARKGERRDTLETFKDAAELWAAADRFCTRGRRVVLFAYDLAYQLRVSQALVHLPELGWKLERIVLERAAAWALLRDGPRSLLCCDLRAWAPVEYARIKSDLNGGERVIASHPAGRKWCQAVAAARVETVRSATLQILAWIEAEGLGPFRPTGSGQSYSAFRRRFMRDKLLVHDDIPRLEAERTAMWTGRAEAWRHGRLGGGPFVEYDMRAAYCHIAAECDVPVRAAATMVRPTVDRVLKACVTDAVLAHVTIETEMPVAPARVGDHTCWPVGRFDTWLWDPELLLAVEWADSVKIHRAYRYRKAPALKPFAEWVLERMGAQTDIYGPIVRHVLKHWSRCLVGRLGLRYRSWSKFGESGVPDLRLVTYLDHVDDVRTDMLLVGYDRLILGELEEGSESLPQVPGWVMSECRRRLWQAMVDAGIERVVYVDTDSMILRERNATDTVYDRNNLAGDGWSLKGRYSTATIYGPRNLELDVGRRVSGLPLTAKQSAPLEFTGEVLKSIRESMRAGELDCVSSIPRSFRFDAPDLRRQHNPDGSTSAYRLEQPCS